MQACGLVNDHVSGCWVRKEVESERATILRAGWMNERSPSA